VENFHYQFIAVDHPIHQEGLISYYVKVDDLIQLQPQPPQSLILLMPSPRFLHRHLLHHQIPPHRPHLHPPRPKHYSHTIAFENLDLVRHPPN